MTPRKILLLPVYNEAETVIGVIIRAEPFVDQILVVDDGSTDTTRQLLETYALQHDTLFFVSHRTNLGMSGALITGFSILWDGFTRGRIAPDDIIITMDSDGQHEAGDIPHLIAPILNDSVALSLGKRSFRAYPWVKRVGNFGLTRWARLWSGYPYRDVECGFRAMKMAVVADILPYFDPLYYGCAQELAVLVARRGWTIRNDVPIASDRYRSGTRIRHGWNNAMAAVRAWRRVRRGRRVATRRGWTTEEWLPYDEGSYARHYRREESQAGSR